MGWNLNEKINDVVSILGNRFITFSSTPDSLSAIGIIFHGELTVEEVNTITQLFPNRIRVDFERLIVPEEFWKLPASQQNGALWAESRDTKGFIQTRVLKANLR